MTNHIFIYFDVHVTFYRFKEWFSDVLVPKIMPGSLIVMDNASYHSRRVEALPVQSWSKAKLMEWLDEKGQYNFTLIAMGITSYQV